MTKATGWASTEIPNTVIPYINTTLTASEQRSAPAAKFNSTVTGRRMVGNIGLQWFGLHFRSPFIS